MLMDANSNALAYSMTIRAKHSAKLEFTPQYLSVAERRHLNTKCNALVKHDLKQLRF